MPGDRKEFDRANNRWQQLHEQQAYSMPAELGKVAIMCSYNYDASASEYDDIEEFASEAFEFEQHYRLRQRDVEIIEDANSDDMRSILRDPSFSSVITIGHGALPYIYMHNGKRRLFSPDGDFETVNNRVDWRDVSRMADHLKTGAFVQRHCGNYARRLSVPLGTFAVVSPSNVWAPVGSYFSPRNLQDPENKRMRRVAELPSLTYEYVKHMFDYNEFQAEQCSSQEASAQN